MKELIKGVLLFVFDWLVVSIFYYFSILVFVGDTMQKIFRTPTMPLFSIFMDILLVVAVSYVANRRLIKAKNTTFMITQVLFGASFIALFIAALGALADGIMNNA
jgi:hypothetical protein